MDVIGLLMLPLAAITTAAWVIVRAVLRREPTFRGAFFFSYFPAVLLMQPWQIASLRDAGMALVMLFMTAIPIAGGCVIGGIVGGLILPVVRRVAHIRDR